MTFLRATVAETVEAFDAVRTQIEMLRLEKSVPSIAVAVARGGAILWEQGFGWADKENRVPATEHTAYSIASVSKPITATGLMTLVQAGKIDLDRSINDYLGVAKLRARAGDAAAATVRRVADHSSGLPLHYQFFFDDEPYRRPSMDETILRYGNLFTAPGERFQYSNLGYGVLDHVIARVSGLTYADFMRREVFTKLGMAHSSIDVGAGLEKYQAIRYDEHGKPIPFYGFDHPGGSAVYASAHDLVRFGMFHLKNRLPDQSTILSDASLDEMHRPTASDGNTFQYAIGWRNRERPDGYRLVSHTGGMPGVAAILELVPAEDIVVVVLLSTDDLPSVAIVRDSIMKVLLPKWTVLESVPTPQPLSRPIPELTGLWEGILHTYCADLSLKLECLPNGDIHVRLGNQLTTLLNDVRFEDAWLQGTTNGDIGTEDANRHPYYILKFTLKQQGDALHGAVTATCESPRPFALTHWAELKKSA